jgi:hypothetical protein
MSKNIKQLFDELQKKHTSLASAVPVDISELPAAKRLRIKQLEQNPEDWFKYYFPAYVSAPPAQFHIEATIRVIDHPEWYEVRNWSRELAKSTRTMMEVFYLTLVGNLANGKKVRKRNVLLISNSYDNAERLLLPYMVNLESNNRIINDYGDQASVGNWTAGEFITKKGVAFRAIGAGQSPRGTRNEAVRPDIILFDDLDTDEDCRNADIIDKHWDWVQEAVIPTRSISNKLLVLWCGNIIAEDCCVLRAQKYADHTDIINIRDADGKSSWPQKNSEADIDRVLSQISYASQQKEYFNNPMVIGKTFPEIIVADCPPLKSLPFVMIYADPSTGNRDKPGAKSTQGNSRKAVWVVGRLGTKYYIYYGFLDVMSSSTFIEALYACRDYVNEQTHAYYYIENNTLQDPIFSQIYQPLIYEHGLTHPHGQLGVIADTREKKDKWFRIEANLEPKNRNGQLIFNAAEKANPHMDRLITQFKSAKPSSKQLDGPDAVEGAVYLIDQKYYAGSAKDIIISKPKRNPKYFG